MPRYIDAEALIDDLLSYAEANEGTYHAEGFKNAVTVVEDQPTADVVEVVRCKYCAHHEDIPYTTNVWCEKVERLLPEDWFCADGEKERNNRQSRRKGENRI